ncbi:MAG: hypothetical protein AVDCRST_MAG91-585, partial [uncultured Sphingomonadaceae bacterium]
EDRLPVAAPAPRRMHRHGRGARPDAARGNAADGGARGQGRRTAATLPSPLPPQRPADRRPEHDPVQGRARSRLPQRSGGRLRRARPHPHPGRHHAERRILPRRHHPHRRPDVGRVRRQLRLFRFHPILYARQPRRPGPHLRI